MIVISCSHGRHLGKSIAKKAKCRHSDLFVEKFPDGEIRVRIDANIKGEEAVFVQSFYGNVSDCIVESILAGQTAKELGAKKIALAAPYFPYLRQDKKFHRGEAVSQKMVGRLVGGCFSSVYVMDPHLHRTKSLSEVFNVKAVKLTANSLIADYIKKNTKNPVIIGPDEESYKWARHVAEMIGAESRILKKKRYSSYHVEVRLNKKLELKGRGAIIVDDIVSTGHTIIETAKILRKLGAKKVYCVCVHGIFVENALDKLRKAKVDVVSTNTIPNKMSRIDVSGIIKNSLIKLL